MRSIRWHTYKGVPQPDGAYYLMQEDTADIQSMLVETITDVLKFAVRDTPPPKAVRPPEPKPEPQPHPEPE
jgi:hypothetical protein